MSKGYYTSFFLAKIVKNEEYTVLGKVNKRILAQQFVCCCFFNLLFFSQERFCPKLRFKRETLWNSKWPVCISRIDLKKKKKTRQNSEDPHKADFLAGPLARFGLKFEGDTIFQH